ncbi:glycerate kinase type-2 family protein [Aliiroseovarius sp. PTFE2010]|uniref:glycerate kinase type-2 family protein n=1 Tax=Aliiroseovarius sp. PTFE2010 TaxID=3417190 RepID=UPI003CF94782
MTDTPAPDTPGSDTPRSEDAGPDIISSTRSSARMIFAAGVAAADPRAGVAAQLDGPLAGQTFARVIAVGKGARAMAAEAMAHLPPCAVLVVTNYENAAPLDGATVKAAGHPVPDDNGAEAARAVEAALQGLGPDDRVLALISGGGSALLPAPADGLSLADKAEVSRLLLASGAEITEMNLIRQQLSRLKGGGMLRAAAPARVTALILSDVVGDDLRVIASGPTVAPIGTRAQAMAALTARGLWPQVPPAVRAYLARADDAQSTSPAAQNILIGSNAISVKAMAQAAENANVSQMPLEGDVADAAARIIAEATGPGTWLWGGETTVRLTGDGLGGRNQELALRLALAGPQANWGPFVFLSGGTDGRDGPTDAAGAIVDHTSLARMRQAGVDPQALLANNDSHAALAASGDLLMTGATGTNVADLQVLIRL